MSQTIMIADDDPHIRDVIRFALEDSGFKVLEAKDGIGAVSQFKSKPMDLIILDIGMPNMDGFDACKAIRKTSDIPILFLTARTEEIDRVLSFELGGDDHVPKPFSPRELILRVRAILKRGTPNSQAPVKISVGDLSMIPDEHYAELAGKNLVLTNREYSLLHILAQQPERVFPKPQLLYEIYGETLYVADRTLDSHIRNLRAKALELGCDNLVATIHGVGIKLGSSTC